MLYRTCIDFELSSQIMVSNYSEPHLLFQYKIDVGE